MTICLNHCRKVSEVYCRPINICLCFHHLQRFIFVTKCMPIRTSISAARKFSLLMFNLCITAAKNNNNNKKKKRCKYCHCPKTFSIPHLSSSGTFSQNVVSPSVLDWRSGRMYLGLVGNLWSDQTLSVAVSGYPEKEILEITKTFLLMLLSYQY